MTYKYIIKDKGLTLFEIIIVVFLFSITLGAIFTALATARTSWKAGSSQLTVQQEARRGLNTMLKELRQGRLSTITGVPTDGTNYSTITFQIPSSISAGGTTWSSNIQYSLGGLQNAQLLRTQDGNQRVLANNISALNFSRNASATDVINVNVSTEKNTFPGLGTTQSNITLNSQIKARN